MKGLSHSRPTSELEAVDLTDAVKTESVFASFAPEWVIHCAAERRPDVADKVSKPINNKTLKIAFDAACARFFAFYYLHALSSSTALF